MKCSNREIAQWHFNEGMAAEQEGEKSVAAMAYEQALVYDPGHLFAMVNLGMISYHQKDFRKAEERFRGALVVDEQYALAHYNLAIVVEEGSRWEEAERHYRLALDVSPRFANAHFNLAELYSRHLADPRKALKHYWLFCRYRPADDDKRFLEVARLQIKRIRKRDPHIPTIVSRSGVVLRDKGRNIALSLVG